MHRIGLVERIGSGIVRMKNAMEEYGLNEPRFDINSNWFTIIFYRPSFVGVEKWSEKWYEKGLTEREIQIITEIEKNARISVKGLAELLNINSSAVQKHLYKLKVKNILERIGPAKGGHWEIRENKTS